MEQRPNGTESEQEKQEPKPNPYWPTGKDKLADWERRVVEAPKPIFWTLLVVSLILAIGSVVTGLVWKPHFFLVTVGFLVLPWIFLGYSLRNIRAADPAHDVPPFVGLAKIFGRRYREGAWGSILFPEGWIWTLPPFFSFIEVPVGIENPDLSLKDIRTKGRKDPKSKDKAQEPIEGKEDEELEPGGEVEIEGSYSYCPNKDAASIREFDDMGRNSRVEDHVDDFFEQAARRMGKRYTWLEYSFAGVELTQAVLFQLTGRQAEELEDRQEAKEGELYVRKGPEGDSIVVFPDGGVPGIGVLKVVTFLGFAIKRIKEQGELAKAGEKRELALQERAANEVKAEFVQAQTREFKEQGVSPDTAADNALIVAGEADIRKNVQVTEIRGVESVGGLANVAVARFLGGGGSILDGGQQPTGQQPSSTSEAAGGEQPKMSDTEALALIKQLEETAKGSGEKEREK